MRLKRWAELRWRDIGRVTMSRLGVQTNDRLEQFIRERLPISRFEELPIPFAAVATDLNSGSPVIMRDQEIWLSLFVPAAQYLGGIYPSRTNKADYWLMAVLWP
jgi:predicted acylesterase/phospholipase RssA